ncbi:MAG TPA: gliding motility-associated ABC transporter ATP-binding subunit GldA [Bacteroidales bacterium]|nr:gliding motility-associated ABC transporter ATP-binding subunit GldA [Bacteroidales bacterium]
MSIEVREVTKYYGSQKALDNVSFTVKTGEIVGFLGPNGAGKSTMMKIITGFVPASSGKVEVCGIDSGKGDLTIRNTIGYLPENNPLYPEMFVREYLGFVASFYKFPGSRKKAIDNIIVTTGLASEQNKKIGALSKGFRQRVGLAQALIHSPGVLILDEPTTGLDPNQIVEIRNLIRETGREKTIMLSTHIMQEVEAICDRIIIIDKGVIVADETREGILSKVRKQSQRVTVEFDRDPGEELLHSLGGPITTTKTGNNKWLIESAGDEDIRPQVFSFAVRYNLTVLSMQKEGSSLEEVFRTLTS